MADEGIPYPSKDDQARLKRYTCHRHIWRGEHKDVFLVPEDFSYVAPVDSEYLTANLCQAATNLIASRLFGEPVELTAPSASPATLAYLAYFIEDNGCHFKHLRAAIQSSYAGDAVFKVRYDADARRVIVDLLNPATYFVETDPLDTTRRTAVNIDNVLYRSYDIDGSGVDAHIWRQRYVLEAVTTPAEVEGASPVLAPPPAQPTQYTCRLYHQLFKLEEDKENPKTGTYDPEKSLPLDALEATAALPPMTELGIDIIPIIHHKNFYTEDDEDIYGYDDYTNVLALQGQINWRETQRGAVLDEFVEPFMYGPELEKEDDGSVSVGRHKYLAVDVPAGAPAAPPLGILTWDAELAAVVEALRENTEKFTIGFNIDSEALLQPTLSGPMSGFALRLRQLKTQVTVNIRQLLWKKTLQDLYSAVLKVAVRPTTVLSWQPPLNSGSVTALEPADLRITFNDGLPRNEMEDIQEQTQRLSARIQSRLQAIIQLDGVTEAEAQALLNEIDADTQVPEVMPGAAPAGSEMFGPGGSTFGGQGQGTSWSSPVTGQE